MTPLRTAHFVRKLQSPIHRDDPRHRQALSSRLRATALRSYRMAGTVLSTAARRSSSRWPWWCSRPASDSDVSSTTGSCARGDAIQPEHFPLIQGLGVRSVCGASVSTPTATSVVPASRIARHGLARPSSVARHAYGIVSSSVVPTARGRRRRTSVTIAAPLSQPHPHARRWRAAPRHVGGDSGVEVSDVYPNHPASCSPCQAATTGDEHRELKPGP